ncbi:MAG: hypothetical protein GXO77_13385 [Calditrichaeota bacterium]|nr:hypothetical protein [Calditrichota bacterium]
MQKPLKKIYITLFIFSLTVTAVIGWYLRQTLTPYQFSPLPGYKFIHGPNSRTFFHDLNNDGFNERIYTGNNKQIDEYHINVYDDHNSGLIDQFNFKAPLVQYYFGYQDINGDGWKEIFAFSHDNDYLYLSIIDVVKTEFLVKEQPVVAASANRVRKYWDIGRIFIRWADMNKDGQTDLLFSLYTGYAREPRSVCVYDLRRFKITRRFDHNMGVAQCEVLDLNGDGFPEVALKSVATKNTPADAYLSDQFSWFVLLDHNLKPVVEPKKIGQAFSSIIPFPYSSKGQNYFLFFTKNRQSSSLWLVDAKGREILRNDNLPIIRSILINNYSQPPQIVCATTGQNILLLNEKLQPVKSIPFPFNNSFVLLGLEDIFNNKKPVFLALSYSDVILLNNNLQLMARYSFKEPVAYLDWSFNKREGDVLPHLSLGFLRNSFELRIAPNPVYSFLAYLYLLIFLGVFLASTGAHWGINKIRQYVSYLIFSMRHSKNAIILLNHRGRIISLNQKVNQFLKLRQPLQRGQYFREGLKQHPDLLQAIEKCVQHHEQVQTRFDFEDAAGYFVGEITVTPFFSYFGFVNAYLIEIMDSTEQVMLERQLNWQRNVRKMVHDIKTPLGGVQLKLQTLYLKLSSEHPDLKPELYEELEEAYSELRRIRNISKDFLKFSDLEQLNICAINLQNLLRQCLEPFAMYTNDFLRIRYAFDPHLPQTVYWDERQIELLLHIIIENSLDALKGSGEINIEVKPSAKFKAVREPWIEIRVQDNGPGISEKYLSKIFEPHFSTKKEGSGMGLAFAKHIVQQHGGQIDFYSEINFGTVFVLSLPSVVTVS